MMTAVARLRGRLGEAESGMVTAFVVVFTLALVAMAGLVLDGGLALSAKVQAIDDAQAAARAGAQAIDIPLYRLTGQITLDAQQATQDAEGFLARSGHTGTVTVDGEPVAVTVTCTVDLADLVGLRLPASQSISSTSTAVIDLYRATT